MRVRSIMAVATVLVTAVGWWLVHRHVPADARVATATSVDATRLSPSSVLAIDRSRASPPSQPARASAVPVTLAREYEQARNLKAIYDRIAAAPRTAEAKYVLSQILVRCAKRTDPVPADQPAMPTWEQQRKRLEASLRDDDPQKAIRLKAFDDTRRCEGLEGVTASRAEVRKLLDDAAREGDPRARALRVQREMDDGMRTGQPVERRITDSQLQTLREAIGSRDPAAIVIAGTILSNTFNDVVIEVGDQPLDNLASFHAWNLLACEYGLDCGAGSNRLLQACAYSGRCGLANLADYLFFFETTPNQAQLIDQYRQVFRHAIDGDDWNGFTFARRAGTGDSQYNFHAQVP